MNKNEKCVIDLRKGRNVVPMKEVKMDKFPSEREFEFVPRFAPQIARNVKSVKWDCVKKTLELLVSETAHFETLSWIQHIIEQTKEASKGPFNLDIENDLVTVRFKDSDDKMLQEITFKNLAVLEHESNLIESSLGGPLMHKVKLKYNKMEFPEISKDCDLLGLNKYKQSVSEKSDEEWQSVEKL